MATVLSYPREYSHMQRHVRRHAMHIETTLYDVIEAVSDQARPGEEHLVAPAVVHLLQDCVADFLPGWQSGSSKNSQQARNNTCAINRGRNVT